MTDTLQNVTLPNDTWVDLYEATGIDVGTQIIVQNVGASPIQLHTKATRPLPSDGFNLLYPGNDPFINEIGDSGAWARSLSIDGLIQIKEF